MDLILSYEGAPMTASFDALRVRLERVLELIQIDRPGAAQRVVDELRAIERVGRAGGLVRFAAVADTAIALSRRWGRGVVDGDDARVGVLRLTLAMIRELSREERA